MNYARVLRQVFPREGRFARPVWSGDNDATCVSKPQFLEPVLHFLEMELERAEFFQFARLHSLRLAFHNVRPCAFHTAVVAREFRKFWRRRVGADRLAGGVEIQAAKLGGGQALNQGA